MFQPSDSRNIPFGDSNYVRKCEVHHKMNESDNLGASDNFPITDFKYYTDVDLYAIENELYPGSRCEIENTIDPWHFWMTMLKNGNFHKNITLFPENGKKVDRIVTKRSFPCFCEECMNQPLIYHNRFVVVSFGDKMVSLIGGFYGTDDLDANLSKGVEKNSYFSVLWQENVSTGSWIISHKLTTSSKYPWLMLYLRADATKGFNGGYHYNGRGIMRKVCNLLSSYIYALRETVNVRP